MTAKQIADSEGNDRYFVMRVSAGGSVLYVIYDRTSGTTARGIGRTTFANDAPAQSKARRLNK